jgi:ribosomal protein S18 acetylase RimI-like enzyme
VELTPGMSFTDIREPLNALPVDDSPQCEVLTRLEQVLRGKLTRNGERDRDRVVSNGWEDGSVPLDPASPEHAHAVAHDHGSSPATGPVADASARVARLNDASAVGLVQAAVWRTAYGQVLPQDVVNQFDAASFGRVWRDSLRNPPSPRHVLLVACAGEQVVGFAAVGPGVDPDSTETSGELLTFGVHPDARRSGHGSRLLNAAVDTLRGRGFSSMSCWILAGDEATRAFLTASGLSPDSAYRDRVVSHDGTLAREVRLNAGVSPE